MYTVSRRWLANLSLARWQVKAEWLPPGGDWQPLVVSGGSVTCASTNQTRWTCELDVVSTPITKTGLSPFGSLVRILMGQVYGPRDIEWVPLGVYRVESTTEDGFLGTVSLSGASLEAQVIDDRFYKPSTIRSRDAFVLIGTLIRQSVPGAIVSVDEDVDPMDTGNIVAERDRWPIIDGDRDSDSIARALGARVYCDGRGVFRVSRVPTLQDEPVWTLDTGVGGALVRPSRTLTREQVYNAVVANGNADDGKPPIGPGIAQDTDPNSPTYIKGPFGRKPRFYSSVYLKTLAQCNTAARGLLAPALGLAQSVSIEALPNYALEVDDVIRTRMPNGEFQNHVIDTISFPLAGGTISMTTRSTSTRLAGTITDGEDQPGDLDSGEGDE